MVRYGFGAGVLGVVENELGGVEELGGVKGGVRGRVNGRVNLADLSVKPRRCGDSEEAISA